MIRPRHHSRRSGPPRRWVTVVVVASALLVVLAGAVAVAIAHVTSRPGTRSALANGGFEDGSLAGWTSRGATGVTSAGPHRGRVSARVGAATGEAPDSAVMASFTAPHAAARVSFWYQVNCPDPAHREWATATLRDDTAGVDRTVLVPTCTTGQGWQQAAAAVTPGHHHTLTLAVHTSSATTHVVAQYDDMRLDQPNRVAGLAKVSADRLSSAAGEHATEVEPDIASWGTTVVATAQVGRHDPFSADGFAVMKSTDAGVTWQDSLIPGVTKVTGGSAPSVSNAAVAYDARHGTWLVTGISDVDDNTTTVIVSRSTDALTWQKPESIAAGDGLLFDKDWIACDDDAASPYYGTCYAEADVFVRNGDEGDVVMSRSVDGGLTWSAPVRPPDTPQGIGGQPVTKSDGTVVVPYATFTGGLRAIRSTDGGATWKASVAVSDTTKHPPSGLRLPPPLPSAGVDATGHIYVAWLDCRFRPGCASNDIVYSTTSDGLSWTTPVRVPIDATDSGVDHVLPAIAVDPSSSGSTTRIALYYYAYPKADCIPATCQLQVGYISSVDDGTSWTAARTIAGPFALSLVAKVHNGTRDYVAMLGDYIGCAIPGGDALSVFPVAQPPTDGRPFDQAMYSTGPQPLGE
jgi:hypothetical protein